MRLAHVGRAVLAPAQSGRYRQTNPQTQASPLELKCSRRTPRESNSVEPGTALRAVPPGPDSKPPPRVS